MTFIERVWRAMLAAAPFAQWVKLGGGMIATLLVIGLVLIVWLGHWPWYLAADQLRYLGIALIICVVLMGLYTVNVTGTSVRGRIGNNEIDVRAAAEEAGREAAREEVAKAVPAAATKKD